jgi:diacylglycerol O-acyltransferase / wax synthase
MARTNAKVEPPGKKRVRSVARSPAKKVASLTRQLNVLDSTFLQLESAQTPMNGGFLHLYSAVSGDTVAARRARLLRHIQQRVNSVPILRRAIVRSPLDIDHGWFVDGVGADLGYHVRHTTLPKPGSSAQLDAAYARIMAEPMDMERPLWEIHLVDGVNTIDGLPKGGFAMIVKFHHAGVDGRSAAEIIAALHSTDQRRQNIKAGSYQPLSIPAPPTLLDAMLRNAERYTRFSTALGNQAVTRLPALRQSAGKMLLSSLGMTGKSPANNKRGLFVPRTIFNVPVSTDRVYTHLTIGFDQIKLIRQRVDGATVNDVFLTLVGGALRRYLTDLTELPDKSLVAGVTIDVRSNDDAGKGGNQFAFVRIPLGTDEPDAMRRLSAITAATTRAKSSVKGKGKPGEKARPPVKWMMIVPAPLLFLIGGANRIGVAARMTPMLNLLATNVPGPRETLYLDGARLIDFSGAPPICHGLGLVVNATSYDGALRVSVSACRKEIPDPTFMRRCLEKSFSELLAIGKKSAGVNTRKTVAKKKSTARPAVKKKPKASKLAKR